VLLVFVVAAIFRALVGMPGGGSEKAADRQRMANQPEPRDVSK